MEKTPVTITLGSPGLDFLLPYIYETLADGYAPAPGPTPTALRVTITAREDTGPDGTLLLIVPPVVVGTGMTGPAMDVARAIVSGRMGHVPGLTDRPVTTVHARAVAAAVRHCLDRGLSGHYVVADAADTTWDALAEGIAHRLGDRRIPVAKPLWGMLLLPRQLRRAMQADMTLRGERLPGFAHPSATDYLNHYDYDNECF